MLSCSCSYISIVLDALDYGFEVFVQHAFMILELYSYLYSDTRSKIYIYIISFACSLYHSLSSAACNNLEISRSIRGQRTLHLTPWAQIVPKWMRVCGSIFPRLERCEAKMEPLLEYGSFMLNPWSFTFPMFVAVVIVKDSTSCHLHIFAPEQS